MKESKILQNKFNQRGERPVHENYKALIKEMKIQINGRIPHEGMTQLLLKCLHYPKPSMDSI